MTTLYTIDRLPTVRRLTAEEASRTHELSNKVYDALEPFRLSEGRRDDIASVMVEAAVKFLEKGL